MKVINANSRYQIFSDDLQTHDKLPVGTYKIHFHPMQGFSLLKIDDYKCNESKIYGNHPEKVAKVIRSYDATDRSLGIILSGDKGMGKSLFVNLLGEAMLSKGTPVIICQDNYAGVSDFIEEIKQDALIIFDEYEKVFPVEDSEGETQNKMLSLFDGMSQTKRMYAITVNEVNKLSDFIKNRTGRFHYHIRFDYPTTEELEVYMQDKVLPEYRSEIKEVALFAQRVPMNYDTLRSVAFELNMGHLFTEAVEDMNILQTFNQRYIVDIYFTNGVASMNNEEALDLFSDKQTLNIALNGKQGNYHWCDVIFNPTVAVVDSSGEFAVHSPACSYEVEYKNDEDGEEFFNGLEIEKVVFKMKQSKSLHYKL